MAAEVASTFEIGPEVAGGRTEVLRCGSWLRGDLVNQTIFFQKSLPLPNTSRRLSKMSSACKSSFKRIIVLGFRIRAGFIHRPEITISNSAYDWQALLWEVRCPGLSSPARWRLSLPLAARSSSSSSGMVLHRKYERREASSRSLMR